MQLQVASVNVIQSINNGSIVEAQLLRVCPQLTRFNLAQQVKIHHHYNSHRLKLFTPIACSNNETKHEEDNNNSIPTSEAENKHNNNVGAAVAFGVGIGLTEGVGKASEFFAGYILEQSLSVDNLFVFVLVFKYFKVPLMYQNRVLSYGIAGAIIFRLSLILLGTATLQRFEAVNLFLAAILLYSSFKLFSSEDDDTDLSENFIVKTCQRFIPVSSNVCLSIGSLSNAILIGNYDGNRFFTVQDGIWKATPLLLTVAVIELSDIAFAVDSIPAVFGVTRDPFIVFSSNLFAILGLRSLYTLISEGMADLEYLQPSIAVVLGFIGFKMILDFFGFHVSTEASLGVVATCLSAGVLLSLMKKIRIDMDRVPRPSKPCGDLGCVVESKDTPLCRLPPPFQIETLNPSSSSNSNKQNGNSAAVDNSDASRFTENGLDQELSLGITLRRIGAGLENLGNTCFLNSVLQCLTYTEPLAAYLQSGKHKSSLWLLSPDGVFGCCANFATWKYRLCTILLS
ncbi:hypothetical protein ACFE04_020274 [Oxalis oulophora]